MKAKEGKMLRFTDAQKMAKKYPDTFGAPTKEELRELREGIRLRSAITTSGSGLLLPVLPRRALLLVWLITT
jgi:hypothetical protein